MKKKDYKNIAKSVIDLEIKALKKLKNSINDSFNEAVESLANFSNTLFCWNAFFFTICKRLLSW
jgi:hypothetical protein